MRLSAEQVQAIRQTARRVLGDGAWVSVFGSRALDDSKGGDIDLLFETDAPRTCFRHRQTYRYSPVSLRHLPEHAESALLALELARRHNRRLG